MIRIEIDTKPDPDCYGEGYYYIFILGSPDPDDDRMPLEYWNEDHVEAEDLLHKIFGARRCCAGCAEIDPMPMEEIKRVCAQNDIIIHRIGERLDENC